MLEQYRMIFFNFFFFSERKLTVHARYVVVRPVRLSVVCLSICRP